jgi:hypothetical protein
VDGFTAVEEVYQINQKTLMEGSSHLNTTHYLQGIRTQLKQGERRDMKKLVLIILAALMAMIALAGCQPETIVETVVVTEVVEVEGEQVVVTEIVEVEAEGPVTLGYAAPSLVGGQLDIQNYLTTAAEEKGWQVITTNANGDPQAQNDDIDYFISLGVDAIVSVPQDSTGICTAVQHDRSVRQPSGGAAGGPGFG